MLFRLFASKAESNTDDNLSHKVLTPQKLECLGRIFPGKDLLNVRMQVVLFRQLDGLHQHFPAKNEDASHFKKSADCYQHGMLPREFTCFGPNKKWHQ